jgi:hypothetical protein
MAARINGCTELPFFPTLADLGVTKTAVESVAGLNSALALPLAGRCVPRDLRRPVMWITFVQR